MYRVGAFYWDQPMAEIQLCRLHTVAHFYTEDNLRDILLPIITKQSKLSLRLIDWLVTNYSKKFPILLKVSPKGYTEFRNLHTTYKEWLSSNHRLCFDVFRRRERIKFDLDGETHETTVGQLVFFNFASRYGVLEFAENNAPDIERDHAETMRAKRERAKLEALEDTIPDVPEPVEKKRKIGDTVESQIPDIPEPVSQKRTMDPPKAPRKRKRQRLSKAPSARCFIYTAPHEVVFSL